MLHEDIEASRLPAQVASLASGLLAASLTGEPKYRAEQAFSKLHQGELGFPHPMILHSAISDSGWRFYNSPLLHLSHLEAILRCLQGEEGGRRQANPYLNASIVREQRVRHHARRASSHAGGTVTATCTFDSATLLTCAS